MDPIATWIVGLIATAVTSSVVTYFTTRAKNLATHDDLDMLVEQVRSVTRETEAIKAEIARETDAIKAQIESGLWDRQKQWEVRRDVVLEYMRCAGRVDTALRDFVSTCQVKPIEGQNESAWREQYLGIAQKWLDRSYEFEGAKGLLDVVSTKELRLISSAWFALRTKVLKNIREGDLNYYAVSSNELQQSTLQLYAAIRKELGIEVESTC